MRYGEGILEEIRRRTDLVQLVGRRVKLVRKGRVMWGCCPFHGEKSPSFKVENERRAYKCFGCGVGGDCFRWVMETEGLSFPESVEKLAAEAGVDLPKWSDEDEAREKQKKSLYDIVELAAKFYEAQLFENAGRPARDYLKSRGLDGAAAKQFRLGYAPSSGQALIAHLKTHNVTQDDMIAAGLARPAEDSSDGRARPMRDFFYDRAMFPISDGRGRTIAFGARALQADAKPKYINTGETVLFSKGHNLYNFATARGAAIKAGAIILAEGYMDVIALVRAGFTHAVAPLGTALTTDQLQLLWRTAPEPILAFDGDTAGLKAAHRAAHLALSLLKPGYSLRFAFLPAGEDPDSFISRSGAMAMQKLLDGAQPLTDVLWRGETEGKDFTTPERLAGLEQNLRQLTSAIGDSKIAEYYRRDFDQRVFDAYKKRAPAQPKARTAFTPGRGGTGRGGTGHGGFKGPFRPQPGTPEAVSSEVKASLLARTGRAGARPVKENELAALLLEEPTLALNHAELVAGISFADPWLDRLRQLLLNLAASGSSLEKAAVLTHLERQGMAELVARFGVRPVPQNDPDAPVTQEDVEARFLRAARDLAILVEWEPERARALDRFAHEGSEEAWAEARRFLRPSGD